MSDAISPFGNTVSFNALVHPFEALFEEAVPSSTSEPLLDPSTPNHRSQSEMKCIVCSKAALAIIASMWLCQKHVLEWGNFYHNPSLLATKFMEVRKKQNLTQKELSDKAGVNIGEIISCESGVVPPLTSLKKVADALAIPLSQFFSSGESVPFIRRPDSTQKSHTASSIRKKPAKVLTVPLDIGARIFKARNAKGDDVKTFSTRVGVSEQTLRNWENGTNCPQSSKLKQLLSVLGTDFLVQQQDSSLALDPVVLQKDHDACPGRGRHYLALINSVPAQAIGQKIFAARTIKNFTRDDLAIKVGVVHETVKNWEMGYNRPGPKKLDKLVVVLDKPLGYFLDQQ